MNINVKNQTTKKSAGDGSVYYDPSRNRYVGEIRWTDNRGNINRKRFAGKKRSDVKRKLDEFKLGLILNTNRYINGDTITFEQYAKHWLEDIQKPDLKPTSYNRIVTTLKYQVYPYIGDIILNQIDPQDIQKMINTLGEQGLSYSTIKKAFNAVNGCIRNYRSENHVSFNPCENIKLPSARQKDPSDIIWYKKEQRELIINEALRTYSNGKPIYRLGQAIVLLMYTGLRIGELIALTWRDIDFDQRIINVSRNAVYTKKDGEYRLINQNSTKSKSGKRPIPMSNKAYDALMEIYKINGNKKYVVSTENNRQTYPRNIDRMFRNIIIKTKIFTEDEFEEDTTAHGVHTLRHTFASMLFNNGCEVKVVSEILGHSSTKITEDIYIHLIQEHKINAVKKLDLYED